MCMCILYISEITHRGMTRRDEKQKAATLYWIILGGLTVCGGFGKLGKLPSLGVFLELWGLTIVIYRRKDPFIVN